MMNTKHRQLYNTNVTRMEALVTPMELKSHIPLPEGCAENIIQWRQTVKDILDRKDHRLMLIVGPCSIHDEHLAMDYAHRLHALAQEVSETIFIIMRVYFEKPRTTIGWKGLINDPCLDNSFDIDAGIRLARRLLIRLAKAGLPTGSEALDPIIPQYIQELITWTAIGARTSESQTHREMSSGLSMPVGFKNGTDGSIDIAINALKSASCKHRFLGVDQNGRVSVIHTEGNNYGHLVLRGGSRPNYDSKSIASYEQALGEARLPANMIVDASHANSGKKPENQPLVVQDIIRQIQQGNTSIVGVMLESNINWGNQKLTDDISALAYGVSITDACIDWQTTEKLVRNMASELHNILPTRGHDNTT